MPKKVTKTEPCGFRCEPDLRGLIERGAAKERVTKAAFLKIAAEERVGLRPRPAPGLEHYETLLYHVLLCGRCVRALLEDRTEEQELKGRLAEIRHEVRAEVRSLLYGPWEG